MSLRVIGSAAFPIPSNVMMSLFSALQSVIGHLASRSSVNEVTLAFDQGNVSAFVERATIEGVDQYLTATPGLFNDTPIKDRGPKWRLALMCEIAARRVRSPLPNEEDRAYVQESSDDCGMFVVRLTLPSCIRVPAETVPRRSG